MEAILIENLSWLNIVSRVTHIISIELILSHKERRGGRGSSLTVFLIVTSIV
jgi:hypothetical protein